MDPIALEARREALTEARDIIGKLEGRFSAYWAIDRLIKALPAPADAD